MKFPSAKKLRESMKQNNNETMKIAKKAFKNRKDKYLLAITISSKQGLFECCIYNYYPTEFSGKYIEEVYQEEYKRIATEFFSSLGYKVSFGTPSTLEPAAWSRMFINWKNNEE